MTLCFQTLVGKIEKKQNKKCTKNTKPLFPDKWTKSAKCLKHVLTNSISSHTSRLSGFKFVSQAGVEVVKGATGLAIFHQVVQSNNIHYMFV